MYKTASSKSFLGAILAVILLSVVMPPAFAQDASEMPARNIGWHLLGVEAVSSYSNMSGSELACCGLSADTPEFLDTFGLAVALSFASGPLSPDRSRWILSPFLYHAIDGESSISTLSSNNSGGRFDHYEIGLRVEQERYINPAVSWVWGGSLSHVQMDHTISNGAQYVIRPQDGWRAGIHLGVNSRLTDHWVLTSRLGYSFLNLNEQGNCVAPIGAGCSITTTGFSDQDSEFDGVDLSIGMRYEF